MFDFLTGKLQLRFPLQIQFFHKLVCVSQIGPRKLELPKGAEKCRGKGGGDGNFKEGEVTNNGEG